MHEFYIKALLTTTPFIFTKGYRQIVPAASGYTLPDQPHQAVNVGCGHCWLTCMDWLRNSGGGGGDSVGEVAIFRLPSLSIA